MVCLKRSDTLPDDFVVSDVFCQKMLSSNRRIYLQATGISLWISADVQRSNADSYRARSGVDDFFTAA